jgi:hypothetical protein
MPPVYPITMYEPTERPHYPHMALRDAEVWVDFIRLHGAKFLGFSYDLALGGSSIELPTETPESLRAWQYLTALKVDAFGWQGNQAWLIEVRPDATVSALGAVICYQLVAVREAFTPLPIIPAIVCRNIQPDVEWVCAQLGVQVFKVGPHAPDDAAAREAAALLT